MSVHAPYGRLFGKKDNPAIQLLAKRSVLDSFTNLEVYSQGVIKKLECCCIFFIFMEIRVKKKIIIRQRSSVFEERRLTDGLITGRPPLEYDVKDHLGSQ